MTSAMTDPSWGAACERICDFAALEGLHVKRKGDNIVVLTDNAGNMATVTWFDDNAARIVSGSVLSAVVGLDEDQDRASVVIDFLQAIVRGEGRVSGTRIEATDRGYGIGAQWEVHGAFGAWAGGIASPGQSQQPWQPLPVWSTR